MSQIINRLDQIQKCWSFPPDPKKEKLFIRVKLFLNADGTLSKSPEILGDHYKTGDLIYDKEAESVRRALWECQPLKNMPVDRYDSWKEIKINLDLRHELSRE